MQCTPPGKGAHACAPSVCYPAIKHVQELLPKCDEALQSRLVGSVDPLGREPYLKRVEDGTIWVRAFLAPSALICLLAAHGSWLRKAS